ncbi:galactosylceramide sulfotransferase [Solea senegalensis]|uniref:Galactosylceramide sulfotransferase n=2 Tax=Solea senegalensis TaxID=28829 RepID=A0AAV6QCE6_SOLSE|nr:galactosylceramide sulfotransferase-like [Solea senegalensis]KAG7486811.1 galactosylceramide sulfotransferase [Solea senegalensis]
MLQVRQKPISWKQRWVKHVTVACFFMFMIVLYCLSTLQIYVSPPELPVPLSCAAPPGQHSTHSPTNGSQQNNKICVPKMDVMFMKTHKTASSTFLNILFRFGEKHNLKFAFPNGRNDFFYPSYFQHTYVQDFKSGMCFNILCNHMRFNAAEVAKVLPRDTLYITILRDPAELFESSFHYFGHLIPLTWSIPGKDKMAEFLRDPNLYFSPNGFSSFYLKNLLFFDFGQDNTLDPSDPQVNKSIGLIAERFHLVMLMEHFEESLILLKDILCWEMVDILFFKLNSRQQSTMSKLTPQLRAKALQWNSIDWKLYKHFNVTFWEKVETYGRERMTKDVAELRRRNAEMEKICIKGGHPVMAKDIHEEEMQPWQPIGERSIMGYNLNKNIDKAYQVLCRKMLLPEIQYLTDLGVNLWVTKLWEHVRNIIN